MTYIVHRYCQRAQPQPLARVVQTKWARSPNWCSGKVAFDVPIERTAGAARRGRGRAVVACAAGSVTHFPHLIATHLHLLTQLTYNSAAALSQHRPTVAPFVHPPGCTLHALHCARIVAFLCFFVAYLCDHDSLALVSLTLTHDNYGNTSNRSTNGNT